MAALKPAELVGMHLNMAMAFPTADQQTNLTDSERASLESARQHALHGRGYSEQQRSRRRWAMGSPILRQLRRHGFTISFAIGRTAPATRSNPSPWNAPQLSKSLT
jgi:hypothetical protein